MSQSVMVATTYPVPTAVTMLDGGYLYFTYSETPGISYIANPGHINPDVPGDIEKVHEIMRAQYAREQEKLRMEAGL